MRCIKRFLCRLLLVFDSTVLVILIFLLKNYSPQYIATGDYAMIKNIIAILFAFFILLTVIILIGKLAIKLTKSLSLDNLKPPYNDISDLNSSYLAAYLGYFFISLSINDLFTLSIVYLIILLLSYKTINQYYNPVFIIMGYKFYSIKTKNNIVVLVITKRYIHSNNTLEFKHLRRISDGCFFDEEVEYGITFSKKKD